MHSSTHCFITQSSPLNCHSGFDWRKFGFAPCHMGAGLAWLGLSSALRTGLSGWQARSSETHSHTPVLRPWLLSAIRVVWITWGQIYNPNKLREYSYGAVKFRNLSISATCGLKLQVQTVLPFHLGTDRNNFLPDQKRIARKRWFANPNFRSLLISF